MCICFIVHTCTCHDMLLYHWNLFFCSFKYALNCVQPELDQILTFSLIKVINMGMSCPRYDELLTETISSKEVQTVETKNKVGNG